MQALFHINSQQSEIRPAENNFSEAHCCKIQSKFSLISLGTERTVALGKVPEALLESMRVPYMEGHFLFPIKYGYSLVGTVVEGSQDWLGKNVHLLHPHQNQCWVSPKSLTEIPSEIPMKRAVLASNLETAVNAVWDAKIQIGDRILVVGFGMIGALVAMIVSKIPGVELLILEKNKSRLRYIQNLDFQMFKNENNFDVTFHTSGSNEGLQCCIDLLAQEGRVVELSWYGTREVTVQLGGSFHQQRKKIISSQVSNIPFARLGRWDFQKRKNLVMKLLEAPAFDHLLTHEIPFQSSPTFFDELRKTTPPGLGYVISY